MNCFSDLPDDVLTVWKACGWHEHREVSSEVFRDAIATAGGSPIPEAVSLLQAIHGLEFPGPGGCVFDIPRVSSELKAGLIQALDATGSKCCPLGLRDFDSSWYFAGEQQKFIIVDEGWTVYFLCPSFVDFSYWLMGDYKAKVTWHDFPHPPISPLWKT